ncbi:MAG: hypothetical protein ACYTAO_04250 [Planctomycetota bacterium]|jgi:hypothetical protein
MGVRQHGVRPPGASGKPSPPNSYGVKPSGKGTKSTGNAPETEKGSVGGVPGRVSKHDPKKNYASGEVKVSKDIPSRVKGEQSKLPGKVQTGYNVKP